MNEVECWYHYFLDRQACNNYAAYLFLAHIGSLLTKYGFQAGCYPPRDTETTGLVRAEIVEIAIINHLDEMLLDTLIKPSIPIPPEVTDIHGISDAMVAEAPTFPEVYPTDAALKDQRVLIYNSAFDIQILNYCCKLHGLPILNLKERSDCLMEWVAQWGGDWSYYYEDYKYFPLPGGGHRALGDCIAALQLIKKMAVDSDQINCPVPIPQSDRKSQSK